MDVERFKSELGEVAVTESHIERERKDDSEDWERIKEHFSEERLVDKVHFSNIEDMKLVHGAVYPNIQFRLEDGWKRMFFYSGDPIDRCFEELEYRMKVYKQIY
ncbi:MAG: hypothetical protein ABEJ87_04880 [Candidatus Nanohalobium sp.]